MVSMREFDEEKRDKAFRVCERMNVTARCARTAGKPCPVSVVQMFLAYWPRMEQRARSRLQLELEPALQRALANNQRRPSK